MCQYDAIGCIYIPAVDVVSREYHARCVQLTCNLGLYDLNTATVTVAERVLLLRVCWDFRCSQNFLTIFKRCRVLHGRGVAESDSGAPVPFATMRRVFGAGGSPL